MSTRSHYFRRPWALAGLGCLLAPLVLLALPPVGFLLTAGALEWSYHRTFGQIERRLLSETDHAAVLAACRDLLASYRRELEAGVEHPEDLYLGSEPGLPPEIRALEPRGVTLFEDGVIVLVGKHWDRGIGLIAFSEDAEEPALAPDERLLIPGLRLFRYDDD